MEPRTRTAFLALILVQAAHSTEEYAFALYEELAPRKEPSASPEGPTSIVPKNSEKQLEGVDPGLIRKESNV